MWRDVVDEKVSMLFHHKRRGIFKGEETKKIDRAHKNSAVTRSDAFE